MLSNIVRINIIIYNNEREEMYDIFDIFNNTAQY